MLDEKVFGGSIKGLLNFKNMLEVKKWVDRIFWGAEK